MTTVTETLGPGLWLGQVVAAILRLNHQQSQEFPVSPLHTMGTALLASVSALACKSSDSGLAPGPTITAVVVSPDSVGLPPGATFGFTATAEMNDGTSGADRDVVWDATGGTITAAGEYTAGSTVGTFRVIARHQALGLADTATVTIASVPPPPEGILFQEDFEGASLSAKGWFDNTNPVVTTSEHHGGGSALQMQWNSGGTTPIQGGSMRHRFTGTEAVYISLWVKYSSNWVGSGQTYQPHEFHLLTSEDGDWIGPSSTHLTGYLETNWRGGNGYTRLSLTDVLNIDTARINVNLTNVTENRAVAGCNGSSDGHPDNCYSSGSEWRNEKIWEVGSPAFSSTAGAPGYKNDWHHLEANFKLNTIRDGKGQLDGVLQYWFDGKLLIDYHNVLIRTAQRPNMRFDEFLIAPYIGDGSPVQQTVWVDDILLATARP